MILEAVLAYRLKIKQRKVPVMVGVGTLVFAKLVNSGAKMFLENFVSVGDILKSSPQISEKMYWRSSP